jgi:uncharacterized RDD family membrane protein YckC
MAIITVSTPFNIDLEFKVAPFAKRLLAWAIDIVIICFYYYLMLRFIYPLFGKGEVISTAAQLFIIILPVLFYQLMFELLMNGQTIGKKLAGIKVIDREGREPGWGQYITRWMLSLGNLFVYTVPYMILENAGLLLVFMVLYVPDFFAIVLSQKSQRIGDLAAGTVVIDSSYKPDINETIYLNIENEQYKPLFPQVMRLSDKDINGIRNLLLVKNPSRDTEHYIIEVAQKIKSLLDIETDLHPNDFLEQLLKDYNFLAARY